MKLPMTREEISPEWLTHAFREGGRDISVASIRVGDSIGGAASKIRLHVDYAKPYPEDLAPPTVILKTCMEEGRGALLDAGFYHRESLFFEHVCERYDVRTVRFYYAKGQQDPAQAAVLLEDLGSQNVRFGSSLSPYSPDEVASGLEAFAEMHGRSMLDPDIASLNLPPVLEEVWPVLETNLNNIKEFLKSPRAFAAPISLHEPDRFGKALQAYLQLVQGYRGCVVHGDAHIGNTYVRPDGSVALLDWQLAATGHWIHDVAYFMGIALDMPDRRLHERDLLKHYLQTMRNVGAQVPDFEDAWLLYKQAIFYGFFTWLTTDLDHQPLDICTAGCARFGTAMVDHDVFACLGV